MPLYSDLSYHYGLGSSLGSGMGSLSGFGGSSYAPSYGYSTPPSYASPTSSFSSGFSSYGRPLSNVGAYTAPPLRSTFAAINRHYKPMLTTISESAYSAVRRPGHSAMTNLTRINSPKIHVHHTTPSYSAPRPIQINTADIDVSSSRYQDRNHKPNDSPPKTSTPERTYNQSSETPSDTSPFMPRVDQHDPPHRSTIKRDRNIVRLSTMRVKNRSKSKSRGELKIATERTETTPTTPTSNTTFTFPQHSPSPEKQGKSSWRDRFGDDLLAKPKESVRKSPGELILEKHIIRDKTLYDAALAAERKELHSRKSVRRQSLAKCPTFKDICKDISADIRQGDDLNATELRQRRASLIMEDEQQILSELTTQLRRKSTEEIVEEAEQPNVVVMVRKSKRKSTKLPTRILVHPAMVEEQAPQTMVELTDSGHEVSPPKWKAIVEHVEEDHTIHKVFKLPKKKAKAKETTNNQLALPKQGKVQRSPSGEDFWGAIGTRESVYYDERRRQLAMKELERKEAEQAELRRHCEEVEAEKARTEQLEKEAAAKAKEAEQKKRVQDMDAQFAKINAMLSAKGKAAEESVKVEPIEKLENTVSKTVPEKLVKVNVEARFAKAVDLTSNIKTAAVDKSKEEVVPKVTSTDQIITKPLTTDSVLAKNIISKPESDCKNTPKDVCPVPEKKSAVTPQIAATPVVTPVPQKIEHNIAETSLTKMILTPIPSTIIAPADKKETLKAVNDPPKSKKPQPLVLTAETVETGQLSPKKTRNPKSKSPDSENASPITPKPRKLKSKSPSSTSDTPKSLKSPTAASPKKKVLKKKPTTDATPIQRTDAAITQHAHVTETQQSQQAVESTTNDVVPSKNTTNKTATALMPPAAAKPNTKPDIEKKIMKNEADTIVAATTNVATEKQTPNAPTTTTTASQSVATKIAVGSTAKSPETLPKVQQEPPTQQQQQQQPPKTTSKQTTPTLSPLASKSATASAAENSLVKGPEATPGSDKITSGPSPSTTTKEPIATPAAKIPPKTSSIVDVVPPNEPTKTPVTRSVVPIVGTKKPIIKITSKMPASLKEKLKRESDQPTTAAAISAANEALANEDTIKNKSSTAAGAGGLSKFTTLGNLNTLPPLPASSAVERNDAAATTHRRHSGAKQPQQRRSTARRSSSAASRSQNGEDADSTYCLSGEESEIWSVNYSASECTGSSGSDLEDDEMGLKPKHPRGRRNRQKKKLDNFDPKKVVKLDTKRKCYVVEEAPKYPMIATPRPLQKRWHYFSDSESESDTDDSSDSDSDSGDSDSESGTDDGCFGTVRLLPGERSGSLEPDDEVANGAAASTATGAVKTDGSRTDGENVRMSTCSNDSGFEGGTAPASPKKMLGKRVVNWSWGCEVEVVFAMLLAVHNFALREVDLTTVRSLLACSLCVG